MSNILFRPDTFGLTESKTMSGVGPTARRARERADARMRRAILEAHSLMESAWGGDRAAQIRIDEALTTSDLFRSAAGAVLDRELLRAYETAAPDWSAYAAPTTVRNFKPKTLMELSLPSGPLTRVPEHTNYPENFSGAAERQISVGKFGEQFGYTFEGRINDEFGELQVIPTTWAARARTTEAHEALSQLVNTATGAPNTGIFNPANKNIYAGALTSENVQKVLVELRSNRFDEDGTKLVAPELQLVVGPALEFQAKRVLSAKEVRTTEGNVTTTEENPLSGVKLTVLPDLVGAAWFVIPVPKTGVKNSIYVAKLAGFETPDLRAKADQGVRLGGGALSPADGAFDDDTVYFRVRHITGAAQGDATFAVGVDGTGTALAPSGW